MKVFTENEGTGGKVYNIGFLTSFCHPSQQKPPDLSGTQSMGQAQCIYKGHGR